MDRRVWDMDSIRVIDLLLNSEDPPYGPRVWDEESIRVIDLPLNYEEP